MIFQKENTCWWFVFLIQPINFSGHKRTVIALFLRANSQEMFKMFIHDMSLKITPVKPLT